MAQRESFSFRKRLRSFQFAWRGIAAVVRSQHSAWIHAAAAVLAVGLGFYTGLGRAEWALVTLAITMVWTAEGLNTAVEALGDAVSRDDHPMVGRAKDAAAGAVLIAAVGAAVIGALVFVPRLLQKLAWFGG